MIGNASLKFFGIVIIRERIKHGVKIGKIIDNSMKIMGAKKSTFNKKKEVRFMPLAMRGKKENHYKQSLINHLPFNHFHHNS